MQSPNDRIPNDSSSSEEGSSSSDFDDDNDHPTPVEATTIMSRLHSDPPEPVGNEDHLLRVESTPNSSTNNSTRRRRRQSQPRQQNPSSSSSSSSPSWRKRIRRKQKRLEQPNVMSAILSRQLQDASSLLVDRLFEYLSNCPTPAPSVISASSGGDGFPSGGSQQQRQKQQREQIRGLTLPASAIGWLTSQLYVPNTYMDQTPLYGDPHLEEFHHEQQHNNSQHQYRMEVSMRDRLSLLKFLFPRVTHLRITNKQWPIPPLKSKKKSSATSAASRPGSSRSFSGSNHDHLDVSYSASTIQSVLTTMMMNAATENPSSPTSAATQQQQDNNSMINHHHQIFLQYYYTLQICPQLDLTMFPNLSVLLLDGIPPEWISGLHSLRTKLELFRMERACIYDVPSFLFSPSTLMMTANMADTSSTRRSNGDDDDSNDGLENGVVCLISPSTIDPGDNSMEYKSLTHLKLSYCRIGESAGLVAQPSCEEEKIEDNDNNMNDREKGNNYDKESKVQREGPALESGFSPHEGQRPYRQFPPLSMMPNLISLSLAHNDIVHADTALAGLSSSPFLTTLDLSYNKLSSMKNAFKMLGNVKTLILTGNNIRSSKGLDRLYSLQHLALDRNSIKDLAAIAGLGGLPELSHLELHGNPLQKKHNKKYRVDVLNLFRETRFQSLPSNATFRDLLHILPVLDGKIATKKELLGLRWLTFTHAITPEADSGYLMVQEEKEEHGEDKDVVEDVVQSSTSTPMVPPVAVIQEDGPPEEIRFAGEEVQITSSTTVVFKTQKAPTPARPRRVSRRTRTRAVLIDDGINSGQKPPLSLRKPKRKNFVRRDDFWINNYDESSPSELLENGIESELAKPPTVAFSVKDVIHSLSPLPKRMPKKQQKLDEEQQQRPPPSAEIKKENIDPFSCAENDIKDSSSRLSSAGSTTSGDTETETANAATIALNVSEGVNLSLLSLTPVKKDEEDSHGGNVDPVFKLEGSTATSVDDGKSDSSSIEPKGLEFTEDDEIEVNKEEKGEERAPDVLNDKKVHLKEDLNMIIEPETTPSTIGEEISNKSNSMPTTNGNHANKHTIQQLKDASFPDNIWDDAISVQSSLGTKTRDTIPPERKFIGTERNSKYDGPESYRGLNIIVNLELYFQCFVFQTPEGIDLAYEKTDSEEKTSLALKLMPKIQLHKSDHAARPLDPSNIRESFRYFWSEEMVPCGKASRSRLIPNRTPRRGFHGDIVFSKGQLELVSECRKLILCASDTALYFISDLDAVTIHAQRKSSRRRFPFPIPENAIFEDAIWPHAVARHLITSLHRITIGFGFQRMTLHFSAPTASKASREFTYVLLTCNKMRTISLLQQLQNLVKEAKSTVVSTADVVDDAITIYNDDKEVLDALSLAIAPEPLGVVLHYQILQQRWKHGDRGAVRRVCVVTDSKVLLFDEDYVGDGSFNGAEKEDNTLGTVRYRVADSADLDQIAEVHGAGADPRAITIIISPQRRLQRTHRWRLLCRDADGAETLVEDVRKAISSFE